jgi:hypothetical protein
MSAILSEPADTLGSAPALDAPVPMSFPAVLRNPGVSRLLAERAVGDKAGAALPTAAARKKSRRDEKEGKRWIRRDENCTRSGRSRARHGG